MKRSSLHESYCNSFNLLDKITVPRNPRSDHLRSALVYCLGSNVTGALIPLRFVGSFFDFIPARLGHSAALDHAVSCLCALYQSRPSNPYHLNKTVCQNYIKSLSALRCNLDDEALRMNSETLCASILLQMCEVRLKCHGQITDRSSADFFSKLNVNFDRGEWGQLSHGTAFLLQYRGVNRYRNAFDYAMLESQLSFVVCNTLSPPMCTVLIKLGAMARTDPSIYRVRRTLFSRLAGMATSLAGGSTWIF